MTDLATFSELVPLDNGLCVISTYLSIAFIVGVQLNYAIAPRISFLSRL